MILIHKKHLLPRDDPDKFYLACTNQVFEISKHVIPDAKVSVTIYDTKKAKVLQDGAIVKMGGAFCEITSRPNSQYIEAHIHIAKDIEGVLDNRWNFMTLDQRSGEYLDSISVPRTKESLFAFTLLHELGHVYHFCRFNKSGMTPLLDGLSSTYGGIKNLIHPSVANRWMVETGSSIIQFVDALEAHCDIFAIHQFPQLWRAVKGTLP